MPGNPVVILTQEAEDNARLAELLAVDGIAAHSYPCIATRLVPFEPSQLLNGRSLAGYRVIAFTSRRGVAGMSGAAAELRRISPLIACVGMATAEAAESELGLQAAIVPQDQTGAGLARAIQAEFSDQVPLLLVRGSKSSGTFQRAMEAAGWNIDEVIVYEHIAHNPEPLGRIDSCIAAVASPSAAETLLRTNPDLAGTCTCVAIGEMTAKRLRQLGVQQVVVSPQPGLDEFAHTIRELCKKGSNA